MAKRTGRPVGAYGHKPMTPTELWRFAEQLWRFHECHDHDVKDQVMQVHTAVVTEAEARERRSQQKEEGK